MPEISRFFGIVIRMYYDDHGIPHFHASYGDHEAKVGINPIQVIESEIPKRALSLVLEWTALHQKELAENWKLARDEQKLNKIIPLE
ncbi:DUF4160 domain-containing protein [bacterium]|nr:DUF4160 domain-containing protein [bacterium]RIK58366.1 MAG: transcriptional regulator [candidate division KSB1 bacterium]